MAGADIATALVTDRPRGCHIFMRVIPNINLDVVVVFFPVSPPTPAPCFCFLFVFLFLLLLIVGTRYCLYNCVGPRLTSRSLVSVKRDWHE